MQDPTYNRKEIDNNSITKLAFILSELHNDNAPIGWSSYIVIARWLIEKGFKFD